MSHPILVSINFIQYISRANIPPINTTASQGCAAIISSVSMLIKFLKYILVGDEKLSWILIVGKSIANPPLS